MLQIVLVKNWETVTKYSNVLLQNTTMNRYKLHQCTLLVYGPDVLTDLTHNLCRGPCRD